MVAICLSMLIACGAVALAQDNSPEYSVVLDGQKLVFDQSPINMDGRILVPLRAIFEACGAEITWVEKTQTVYAQGRNNTTIELQVGKNYAYINGDVVELSVPAVIYNSRTLVPVRFVAEALGAKVDWNEPVVTITTNITAAQYILIPADPGQQDEVTLAPIANETPAPAPEPAPAVTEPAPAPAPAPVATPAPAPQDTRTVTTSASGHFYTQEGIKGACYITSLGMIAANLTGVEWPASKVYAVNGNSVIGGSAQLLASLGIKRDQRINFTNETGQQKVDKVVSLLASNPEGVIIKFQSKTTTHFIVVVGYKDGKLVVNDPVGQERVTMDKCWTGYGMFSSYGEAIENMVLVEYFSKA